MKQKRNMILLVVVVTVCAVCILSVFAQDRSTTRPRDLWDSPPSHFRGPDGREIGPQNADGPETALQRLELMSQTNRSYWETSFDPEKAGVVAAMRLGIEFRRSLGPDETVRALRDLLENTKTLGLRNILRMGLVDAYKAQNNSSKAVEQLMEMFKENEQALQGRQKTGK